MKELERRTSATQSTIDLFKGKPFVLGQFDCFQMVKHQTSLLGFNWTLVNLREYHSPIGAKRGLQQLGVDTISGLLDLFFKRLPSPAFARVGDIMSFPTAGDPLGIGAATVYCGNQMILSYHQLVDEAVQARIIEPADVAWSAA